MKMFKKKIHIAVLILLGLFLGLGKAPDKTARNLAPQSIFVGAYDENTEVTESPLFNDRYLSNLEELRAYLARGEEKQVDYLLKQLPPSFKVHRFNSRAEVKKLLTDIVDAQDYALNSEVNDSPLFKDYIEWVEDVFPGMFDVIRENDMDFSTESLLQVLTLLTENAFQHGEGQCILILGSAAGQHYFSLVSRGEFKSVKGAMVNREEKGAVRGENSDNGVALSEALGWYLSEVNELKETYYKTLLKNDFDVLITGRDGKFSYRGLLADRGYSTHYPDKGGATATFSLGKNKVSAFADFLATIIESEYMFKAAA